MKYMLFLAVLAAATWIVFQLIEPPDGVGSALDEDAETARPAPLAEDAPEAPPPAVPQPPHAVDEPLGGPDGKIVYPEGRDVVAVFRHARLVAEYGAVDKPQPPAVGARLVHTSGRWRVWESPAGVTGWAMVRAARTADPARQLSPVYLRSASGAGRARTLPGGIKVRFRPAWTPAQIAAFASTHGLTGGSALPVGTGWHSFDSAPGEAALRLAIRIQRTGTVLFARPTWADVRLPK